MKLPFKVLLAVLLLPASTLLAQSDVSVDLNTGRPQISVPLWTVQTQDLYLPIVVSYNANEYELQGAPGSAGMGWSLRAGGSITRKVRGLPDDYDGGTTDQRRGWLSGTIAQQIADFSVTADDDLINTCSDETSNWNTINGFNYLQDTEPDLFTFNAGGISGQFVFDNDKEIRTIPYLDVKITYTRNSVTSAINKFEITTNTGTVYTFDVIETSTKQAKSDLATKPIDYFKREYNLYKKALSYNTAWHLNKITSTATGAFISIGYDIFDYTTTSPVELYDQSGLSYSLYKVFESKRTWKPTSIRTDNNIWVTFRWMGRLVTNVNLSYAEGASKQFSFSYSYQQRNRVFLTKVTEEGNCAAFPAYQFEYFAMTFANEQSPSVDYKMAGALNKILYPSGGHTKIIYESNDYFDAATNKNSHGEGIRVKKLHIHDGLSYANDIIKEYEYKAINGTSSGKILYPPVFSFQSGSTTIKSIKNLAPESDLSYDRVTVRQTGKGRQVYEFTNPAMYPSETANNNDWVATRTKIVRPSSCPSAGDLKTGFYTFPFPPNTNYGFERGLLSKLLVYNEADQLLSETQYTYQRLSPQRIEVKGLCYDEISSLFHFGKYSLLANVGKVLLTESNLLSDMGNVANKLSSSTTYTYSSTSQLLQAVSTVNSDGVIHKQRFRYAKDYTVTSPAGDDKQAIMISRMNNRINFMHGKLIENIISSVTRTGVETVTGVTLTKFHDFGMGKVLPEQLWQFPPVSGFQESYIASTPAGQTFVQDSRYVLVRNLKSYDDKGNILALDDNRRNRRAYQYGYTKTLPVVELSNAAPAHVMYTNFETTTGYELTHSLTSYAAGRTGSKALNLPAEVFLQKSGIEKGGRYYRFSCWINAVTAAQISCTVVNGSGITQTSGIVDYLVADAGKWKYLEKIIDLNAVTTPFTLKVKSNSAVTIDDIAFYPSTADIKTYTHMPPFGKTSETDARGIGVIYEYDGLGRIKYIRDQDKNIVKKQEYQYRSVPTPAVNSSFTYPNTPIFDGSSATFTAGTNCLDGTVAYAWFIDNGTAPVGTGQTLNYTFSQVKQYIVKLTVTHSLYGSSSTEQVIEVKLGPLSANITLIGSSTVSYCDNTGARIFEINNVSGCPTGSTYSYMWEVRYDVNIYEPVNGWKRLTPDASTATSIELCETRYYAVRCIIESSCGRTVITEPVQVSFLNNCPPKAGFCF